jgi:aldehyde:ferredoxin oxidoreductase
MGSKKLKAVVVDRGKKKVVPLKDKEALAQMAKEILAGTLANKFYAMTAREGTAGGLSF